MKRQRTNSRLEPVELSAFKKEFCKGPKRGTVAGCFMHPSCRTHRRMGACEGGGSGSLVAAGRGAMQGRQMLLPSAPSPWDPKWLVLGPSREGDVKVNILKHSGKWKIDFRGATPGVACRALSTCVLSCTHIWCKHVGWIPSWLGLVRDYSYWWDWVGFTPAVDRASPVGRRNGPRRILLGRGSNTHLLPAHRVAAVHHRICCLEARWFLHSGYIVLSIHCVCVCIIHTTLHKCASAITYLHYTCVYVYRASYFDES